MCSERYIKDQNLNLPMSSWHLPLLWEQKISLFPLFQSLDSVISLMVSQTHHSEKLLCISNSKLLLLLGFSSVIGLRNEIPRKQYVQLTDFSMHNTTFSQNHQLDSNNYLRSCHGSHVYLEHG